MSSHYKKVANNGGIGPGGINCPCCGPAPGKERKAFFRSGKRREKQKAAKETNQQILDGDQCYHEYE